MSTTSRARRTVATVALASGLALLAGACGDDEGAATAPAPAPAAPGAPAPPIDEDDDERPDGYDEAPPQPGEDEQDDDQPDPPGEG